MTRTSPLDEQKNAVKGRSRRLLLAGAAGALGLLAGEALAPATPAQAGTDGDVVLGSLNNASTTTTIDTVTSGQDTVAFAAADARTLSVENDSLQQTVLAINNGGGARRRAEGSG
jgi:ABC-type transport system substrate-binding protein